MHLVSKQKVYWSIWKQEKSSEKSENRGWIIELTQGYTVPATLTWNAYAAND